MADEKVEQVTAEPDLQELWECILAAHQAGLIGWECARRGPYRQPEFGGGTGQGYRFALGERCLKVFEVVGESEVWVATFKGYHVVDIYGDVLGKWVEDSRPVVRAVERLRKALGKSPVHAERLQKGEG